MVAARRFVLLVCAMLLARVGHATNDGGVFSGPGQATGSSIYWNPAALADSDSNLFVVGGWTRARVSYRRDGIDQRSGEPYRSVSTYPQGPLITMSAQGATPWPWLRWIGGGFSPTAGTVSYPEDGPQRYFAIKGSAVAFSLVGGVMLGNFARDGSATWGVAATAGATYLTIGSETAFDFGNFINGQLGPGAELFEPEDPTLEGRLSLSSDGIAPTFVLGAWGKPFSWWQLGAGFHPLKTVPLNGSVDVQQPESFGAALPGVDLNPHGKLSIDYALPWQLHAESEWRLRGTALALHFDYIRRTVRTYMIATIRETEPSLIEGDTLSVAGVTDDYTVAARLRQRLSDALELALRIDIDPRYVPNETVNPLNLDFTSVEYGIGAAWRFSDVLLLRLSYGYRYMQPIAIELQDTLYNPRNPPSSGLAGMPPIGDYSASNHRAVVGVDYSF